ncbi:type IV pilus modification PilV family protein [Geobacter pickeringii]|uniref:type IV pilus modification PilV family protein n=1 Tax=Geobacter pickeringii TaxID=345632 RepID=UPI00068FB5AF|nr:prepilin-type N-terminal cleavage/methylation domain-containing protein [Geobacter pickeringii]
MDSNISQHDNQRGFTLVELLVSLTILSIGLFAVANMQVVALKANTMANSLSVATTLAQEALEDIMSTDSGSPLFSSSATGVYDLDPNSAATSLTVPGAGTFTATYTITTSTPSSGMVRVDVEVVGGGRDVKMTCYKRVI